jgi:hypothetical protein
MLVNLCRSAPVMAEVLLSRMTSTSYANWCRRTTARARVRHCRSIPFIVLFPRAGSGIRDRADHSLIHFRHEGEVTNYLPARGP